MRRCTVAVLALLCAWVAIGSWALAGMPGAPVPDLVVLGDFAEVHRADTQARAIPGVPHSWYKRARSSAVGDTVVVAYFPERALLGLGASWYADPDVVRALACNVTPCTYQTATDGERVSVALVLPVPGRPDRLWVVPRGVPARQVLRSRWDALAAQ